MAPRLRWPLRSFGDEAALALVRWLLLDRQQTGPVDPCRFSYIATPTWPQMHDLAADATKPVLSAVPEDQEAAGVKNGNRGKRNKAERQLVS